VQGIAMAFMFVPLTTIVLSGLPPERIAAATGLSNFFRMTAGAFGTSVTTTMWDNRAQLHHAQLAEHISDYDTTATLALNQLQAQGMDQQQALGVVNRLIDVQSYTLAADELFFGAAMLFLVLIAFIWLAHPGIGRPGVSVSDAH